jgi:hypothetical protein
MWEIDVKLDLMRVEGERDVPKRTGRKRERVELLSCWIRVKSEARLGRPNPYT